MRGKLIEYVARSRQADRTFSQRHYGCYPHARFQTFSQQSEQMVGIAFAVIEHAEAQPAFWYRALFGSGCRRSIRRLGDYQNNLLHVYPLSLMGRIDRYARTRPSYRGMFHPSHSQTPRPIIHSLSSSVSHGISSVNIVTPSRYVHGKRDKSVPQNKRCGP